MYIRVRNNTHWLHLLFFWALLLLRITMAQPNENTSNAIPEITSAFPSTAFNVADDNVDSDVQSYTPFVLYVWGGDCQDCPAMNFTIQTAAQGLEGIAVFGMKDGYTNSLTIQE
jgi:hypothetical protein